MFALKPLSHDAIPAALERAERYRLLNEPIDAESICEDVLRRGGSRIQDDMTVFALRNPGGSA